MPETPQTNSTDRNDASAVLDAPLRRAFGFDGDDDASWFAQLGQRLRPLSLGRIGSYELLAEAGRGGQGVVYRARQQWPARDVALKRLAAGIFATPSMRTRFEREIETVAALDHPNIVKLYGTERHDDQLIVALQWIDGVPLDRWAQRDDGSPRPLGEILSAFVKICDAVQHAHQRGVIHRDLKPSNVLVDAAGEPHVLDFGLARREYESSSDPGLTLSGAFLGTPAFASPEQLRGNSTHVDARSDVYSLGAMLYQCVTGLPPVDPSLSHAEMLRRIEHGRPRPPERLNPSLNREMSAIVLKALRPELDIRYPGVDALVDDLRRYQRGIPVLAHSPSAAYRVRKFAWRNRVMLTIATGGVGVAGVTIALSVSQAHRVKNSLARISELHDETNRTTRTAELDRRFERAISLEESGKRAEAEAVYREVLAGRRELYGDKHASIAEVGWPLGRMLFASRRSDDALPVLELAFAAALSNHGPAHRLTADTGTELVAVQLSIADYAAAEATARALAPRAVGKRDSAHMSLFRSLLLQHEFADAIEPARANYEYSLVTWGEAHRYTANNLAMWSEVLRLSGDPAGARAKMEESLALAESMVATDRRNGAVTVRTNMHLWALGFALLRLHRVDEAEVVLAEAAAASYGGGELGRTRQGTAKTYLGMCYIQLGRHDEGERLLIEGQTLMEDPSYLHGRFLAVLELIEHYDATGQVELAAHWRDCLAHRRYREWLPPVE